MLPERLAASRNLHSSCHVSCLLFLISLLLSSLSSSCARCIHVLASAPTSQRATSWRHRLPCPEFTPRSGINTWRRWRNKASLLVRVRAAMFEVETREKEWGCGANGSRGQRTGSDANKETGTSSRSRSLGPYRRCSTSPTPVANSSHRQLGRISWPTRPNGHNQPTQRHRNSIQKLFGIIRRPLTCVRVGATWFSSQVRHS
jgi:hypothetical protein